METKNKNDAAAYIANELVMTKKDATQMIDKLMEFIIETNADGDKVQFIGLGSFTPVYKKEHWGPHPKTGEKTLRPAKHVPVFNPGKAYRERVNQLTK